MQVSDGRSRDLLLFRNAMAVAKKHVQTKTLGGDKTTQKNIATLETVSTYRSENEDHNDYVRAIQKLSTRVSAQGSQKDTHLTPKQAKESHVPASQLHTCHQSSTGTRKLSQTSAPVSRRTTSNKSFHRFWHRPFAVKYELASFQGMLLVETVVGNIEKSWHLEAIKSLTREQYGQLKMKMFRLVNSQFNIHPKNLLVQSRQTWETLQEGTFGTVYVGWIINRGRAAIKVPVANMIKHDPIGVMKRYISEWDILSRCDHPNIVKLYGGIVLGVYDVWLCTELVQGMDLHSVKYGPNSVKCIPQAASLKMCRQLADAILYLHTSQKSLEGDAAASVALPSGGSDDVKPIIVHRDIKPENVIVLGDWSIKLCDFGDAIQYSAQDRFKNHDEEGISGATWLYAPPELLLNKTILEDVYKHKHKHKLVLGKPTPPLSEKWDIWSMGCVFQEMFGYPGPFHHLVDPRDKPSVVCEKMILGAAKGIEPYIPAPLASTRMGAIIRSCLTLDPYTRPSAQLVCKALAVPDAQLLAIVKGNAGAGAGADDDDKNNKNNKIKKATLVENNVKPR